MLKKKSFTKRSGELRHTHIFGIKPIDVLNKDSLTVTALKENVIVLRQRVEQAETSLSEATEENKMFKQRIDQLQRYCPAQLSDQLAHLTFPSNAVYHGPDTVQHFSRVYDGSECKEYAPDLLKLVMQLGQTDRYVSGSTPYNTGELKALMSLFTLVKCRSTKVLGIQLLITFMLIARSASRQVINS